MVYFNIFFFFFQAEDGIRDRTVTGVQTCALPISGLRSGPPAASGSARHNEPAAGRRVPARPAWANGSATAAGSGAVGFWSHRWSLQLPTVRDSTDTDPVPAPAR